MVGVTKGGSRMSETLSTAENLAGPPNPAPERRLRGNLGVPSIVFMVVAAAAPLGVIGGVVPLGIASGNGAGFPATGNRPRSVSRCRAAAGSDPRVVP